MILETGTTNYRGLETTLKDLKESVAGLDEIGTSVSTLVGYSTSATKDTSISYGYLTCERIDRDRGSYSTGPHWRSAGFRFKKAFPWR